MADADPIEDAVAGLVEAVEDRQRRDDCRTLISMMSEATGEPAHVAAANMLGFGSVAYRYDSGRTGQTYKIGFSPRSDNVTIYLLSGMVGYEDLLAKLGKHRKAKSCIHVRRLADIDTSALVELLDRAVRHVDQVVADRGALPRMSDMPPYRPG